MESSTVSFLNQLLRSLLRPLAVFMQFHFDCDILMFIYSTATITVTYNIFKRIYTDGVDSIFSPFYTPPLPRGVQMGEDGFWIVSCTADVANECMTFSS